MYARIFSFFFQVNFYFLKRWKEAFIRKELVLEMIQQFLSYDVASESEITPCIKIDKDFCET